MFNNKASFITTSADNVHLLYLPLCNKEGGKWGYIVSISYSQWEVYLIRFFKLLSVLFSYLLEYLFDKQEFMEFKNQVSEIVSSLEKTKIGLSII